MYFILTFISFILTFLSSHIIWGWKIWGWKTGDESEKMKIRGWSVTQPIPKQRIYVCMKIHRVKNDRIFFCNFFSYILRYDSPYFHACIYLIKIILQIIMVQNANCKCWSKDLFLQLPYSWMYDGKGCFIKSHLTHTIACSM